MEDFKGTAAFVSDAGMLVLEVLVLMLMYGLW